MTICAFHPDSIRELAGKSRLSRQAVSRNCDLLESLGWVKFIGTGKRRRPVPVCPKLACAKWIETRRMVERLVPFKGEWLMKLWLDLLIASDGFVDNARPLYLKRPSTDEPLEYDRLYYRLKVAFEHNGAQHYRTTKKFPVAKAQKETEDRDLMKVGLSAKNGVELVIITAKDLTFEGMLKKIPRHMPLSGIHREDPRVVFLERLCREYRGMDTG